MFSRLTFEWKLWWKNQSFKQKLTPLFFVSLYWSLLFFLKGFRTDHLHIGLVILFFAYTGPRTRPVFKFLLPAILTAMIYDSQRFWADYVRGPVHVEFPYWFDKTLFGVPTPEGILTPNEWFQKNTHWFLDFVTGFFYLFFIAIYVLICAYHQFFYPKIAKDPVARHKSEKLGPYLTWSFFWVNMLGYSTYYWFAAAPPWYVADHGLGPAKMDVMASPAGCIRFDELLGTHFFTGMYGRSADVFGAIPSLHIAYPFLSVLFAFQFQSLRVFSLLFYLIMCFSAVYLNHHYVIDLIWGTAYAIFIWWCVNRYTFRSKP